MTLRQKTLLIIGVVLTSLIGVMYIIASSILLSGYENLEKVIAERNGQRLLNSISNNIENLSATAADWAYWDDTYKFIQGNNPSYIETNLDPATLGNLKVNMMLFYDNDGQLQYSIYIDLITLTQEPLPDSIKDSIPRDSILLQHTTGNSVVAGILNTPEGLLIVSSRAIHQNYLEQPVGGTLVLGYYLRAKETEALAKTIELPVTLYPLSGSALPTYIAVQANVLTPAPPLASSAVNDDRIWGFVLLSDIEGNPAAIAQVEMPREIYKQGKTGLLYLLTSLVVVGLAAILLVLWLIEKLVLSRLIMLSASVAEIRRTSNPNIPIKVTGNDELSNLSSGFREMLGELAQAQQNLATANADLENRVEQRTAELTDTNKQLQQEIAERHQAQLELAQARDQAIDALRLKSQILANVSHDARTPLNIITLMVEMLQSDRYGELNPKQAKSVDRINMSAQELLGFINNMLEGARLEGSNKVMLLKEPFSPQSLLDDLSTSMRPLAERKGLVLETHLGSEMPSVLVGDFDKLKQIILNLVTNAIKFTTQGSIKIEIDIHTHDRWRIAVSDTGLGISPKDQTSIFEAFWQVDGSITREAHRGVGLGLSIVKQLTILMDGEIFLTSQLGRGSTFTVLLPIIQPENLAKEPIRE